MDADYSIAMVQVRDDSDFKEMDDNGAIGYKIESMCHCTFYR